MGAQSWVCSPPKLLGVSILLICVCSLLLWFCFWGRYESESYYRPSFTFPRHLVSLNFLSHMYRLLKWTPMNCPLIVFIHHCSVLSCYWLVDIYCGCYSFGVTCLVASPGLLLFNFVLALLYSLQVNVTAFPSPNWKEWILGFLFAPDLLVIEWGGLNFCA